jgi:transposase
MLTIGVDAHKHLHVAVAVAADGHEVGCWQGPNDPAGWQALASWAADLAAVRQWGIEGSGGYGRGLAQLLVSQAERVCEVNPRWVAERRSRLRRSAKTDHTDALAIAQLVQREGDQLPPVAALDPSSLLQVLTHERTSLVAEATALRNQLHAALLQLDPDYHRQLPPLTARRTIVGLSAYQPSADTPDAWVRASQVRRLAERLLLVLTQTAIVTAELERRAKVVATPLHTICGVGWLTAGMLAGYLGPGQRFSSDAALANYAGVAPLAASSAGQVRHRLNRGGQRQLNAVIHRIALTQLRWSAEAQAYVARREREGKTRREAIRALKRYIVRRIWQCWRQCEPLLLT